MTSQEIDLAQVSKSRYRRATRLPRWIAGLFSPVIAIAVVYRAISSPPSAWFDVALGAAAFLAAFGVWMAAFVLIPGPVKMVVETTDIHFLFGGHKAILLNPEQFARRMELQRRNLTTGTVPRPPSGEPDFYVRRGLALYSLTNEAFVAIESWMERASYSKSVADGRYADKGWTITHFEPRSSGSFGAQ